MRKFAIGLGVILLSFVIVSPARADWCLTGNECIDGGGGPCDGTLYESEATCTAALPKAQQDTEAQKAAQASGKECVIKGDNCVPLQNPLGAQTDIRSIIGNVLQAAIGIMGSLALLVFVVGGFLWLTAAGREEQIKKGTQTMVWAAIGIVVIFSSYAIISLVLQGLGV